MPATLHDTPTSDACPSLTVLTHRPAASVRLYAFPPAGLGPEFYAPWCPLLPPTIEFCAVQLPGRGARADHVSITDPQPLLASLADLVHTESDSRPFALFGHSVGALLAFETTRRLRRTRRRLPSLLALSAFPAPHLDTFHTLLMQTLYRGGEGMTELLGPIPSSLRDARQIVDVYTPLLADVLLAVHHRHRNEPSLDVDLALYGGQDDPIAPPEQLTAWNDLVALPTTPHFFPGAHLYTREQATAMTKQLAHDVTAATRHADLNA